MWIWSLRVACRFPLICIHVNPKESSKKQKKYIWPEWPLLVSVQVCSGHEWSPHGCKCFKDNVSTRVHNLLYGRNGLNWFRCTCT